VFRRYVAIGDSSTEGYIDPDPAGGLRGWSRRLAARIAREQGGLEYANLGVRGLTTREIRNSQLAPALGLAPDLATLFSGTNDVIGRDFDDAAYAADVEAMQRALREAGATVLTFTLPDLTPLMPMARKIAPSILALNARTREVSARTGTLLVDFAAYPVATDRRLWNPDRIHANSDGHARITDALAHALGLPGSNGSWREPLAEPLADGALERGARELYWRLRYALPWMLLQPVFAARARHVPVRPAVFIRLPGDRGA
jgi:lysophospholipase L1-like esterase